MWVYRPQPVCLRLGSTLAFKVRVRFSYSFALLLYYLNILGYGAWSKMLGSLAVAPGHAAAAYRPDPHPSLLAQTFIGVDSHLCLHNWVWYRHYGACVCSVSLSSLPLSVAWTVAWTGSVASAAVSRCSGSLSLWSQSRSLCTEPLSAKNTIRCKKHVFYTLAKGFINNKSVFTKLALEETLPSDLTTSVDMGCMGS